MSWLKIFKKYLTLTFYNDIITDVQKGGTIMKTLTIRLEEELHKEFKKYSIDKGEDMQKIIIDCIKKLLSEHK